MMKKSRSTGCLFLFVLFRFYITPGYSQNFFGETTNDADSDKGFDQLLQKLPRMRKPTYAVAQSKSATVIDLRETVITRFRNEMLVVFSWLPEPDQCKVILNITRKTHCRTSDVVTLLSNFTELPKETNVSCPAKSLTQLNPCVQRNREFVDEVFYRELVKVFALLPAPFKCHVIYSIASAYNLKGRRHLRNLVAPTISISQAQSEVARMLPGIQLPQTCADVFSSKQDMSYFIPMIPLVNLTVNLTSGDKGRWLNRLQLQGPDIYRIVCEYEAEKFSNDRIRLGSMMSWTSAENKELIHATQLTINTVGKGNVTFSVLFGLKVKKKLSGRLREMRSTHKIVKALQYANRKKLNSIIGANIISIGLHGGQRYTTENITETNIWSVGQIDKAKNLFPKRFSAYFKQLEEPARCRIVFYISLQVKKSPEVLEMVYSSFKLLSRKHTCYYTYRTTTSDPIISTIDREILIEPSAVMSTTAMASPANTSENSQQTALGPIPEKVGSGNASALEISLFSLLGVLCIAILAFIVNCVIFTFKAKSGSIPNGSLSKKVVCNIGNKDLASFVVDKERIHITLNQTSNTLQSYHVQKPSTPDSRNTARGVKTNNLHTGFASNTTSFSTVVTLPRAVGVDTSCSLSNDDAVHEDTAEKQKPQLSCNTKTLLQQNLSNISVPAKATVPKQTRKKKSLMEGYSGDWWRPPSCTKLFQESTKTRVLETIGNAVHGLSYKKGGLEHGESKFRHYGSPSTELSHEKVFVMLTSEEVKEERV